MGTQPATIMASHLPMIKRLRNNPRKLHQKVKNQNAAPKTKNQNPMRNLRVIRLHRARMTTRRRINAVDHVADHENQKVTDPAVRTTTITSQNTIKKLVTLQLHNVAVVEAAPVAGDTAAVDNNQANEVSVVAPVVVSHVVAIVAVHHAAVLVAIIVAAVEAVVVAVHPTTRNEKTLL